MKEIEKLISPLIEQQFPSIYREEGETFIAFVKAYFEWMEQTNGVIYDSRRLPEYRDIDTTIDRFVEEFRKKYMYGVPKDAAVDKRILQKHIKDLYSSKGTEQGVELLFRLLFNESASVYVPGQDVLRASDGKWVVPRYLEMQYSPNLSLYVGKEVFGRVSGARAIVKDYQVIRIGSVRFDLLYIEDLVGNFLATEEIVNQEVLDSLGLNIMDSPKLLGSMTSIRVDSSTPGFKLGDVVDVSGTGYYGKAVVTATKKLNGTINFSIADGGNGYSLAQNVVSVTVAGANTSPASFEIGSLSNTFTLDLTTTQIANAESVAINAANYSAFAPNTSANSATSFKDTFDVNTYTFGTIASLKNIDPGSGYFANATVTVEDTLMYPLRISDGAGGFYGKNANITAVAGFGVGAIQEVRVYDGGLGYTDNTAVTMTLPGNTEIRADGFCFVDSHGTGEGYFENSDGFLSADKFLHDNYFYQEYSYEVQSGLSLTKYAGILRDLWHIAGTERFGKTIFKQEYKSRGTTVEALIDWLELVDVNPDTTRFTNTQVLTSAVTNYATNFSEVTNYETSRDTTTTTDFNTVYFAGTTVLASTAYETATAFLATRDTIRYTETTVNSLVARNTDTTIQTNKLIDTATVLSTTYNTATNRSTLTQYETSSGVASTSRTTSTSKIVQASRNTDTALFTETSRQTVRDTNTFTTTSQFAQFVIRNQALLYKAEMESLGWSCTLDYDPDSQVGEKYYNVSCVKSTPVTIQTIALTSYNTTTLVSTSTTFLANALVNTTTVYDVTTKKLTSKSTSTVFDTQTTINTFRLTQTNALVDTKFLTQTAYEVSTVLEVLPSTTTVFTEYGTSVSRDTTTIELRSTSYRTVRYTDTTIDTAIQVFTSAATSRATATSTAFDTALMTNKIRDTSKTTSFNTAFLTDTTFQLTGTLLNATTFVTSIGTLKSTNRTTDTAINSGTALITSVDTDTIFDTLVDTDLNTTP